VNPDKRGTKAAAHYTITVGPGQRQTTRLRLCDKPPGQRDKDVTALFADFDWVSVGTHDLDPCDQVATRPSLRSEWRSMF
jgi:hypothetical protein